MIIVYLFMMYSNKNPDVRLSDVHQIIGFGNLSN